jgi:hypothetical protein
MMTCTQLILYFLVAASFPSMASADWGDYADDTFNCPAMTTCKQVCVPNITDCPIEMLCQGNETLCGDGSCSESCDEFLESPCLYGCAPVACAKFDDFHTSCLNLYGPLYDFEAECGAEEIAEATHLWSFTEPGFVFFYAWISGVTFVLLTWCAYNQRFSPVPGSTQPLQINAISGSIDEKSTTQGWQNGYKFHPIGVFLNFLTVVTLFGIQGLLFWLCIQYYIQQEAILSLNGQFDDEEQVLLAFVITWCKFQNRIVSFSVCLTMYNVFSQFASTRKIIRSSRFLLVFCIEVPLFHSQLALSALCSWRGDTCCHLRAKYHGR